PQLLYSITDFRGNAVQAQEFRQEVDDELERCRQSLFQCSGGGADIARGDLGDAAQEVADHLCNLLGFLDEEHDGVVNAHDGPDNTGAGHEQADDGLDGFLDNFDLDEILHAL